MSLQLPLRPLRPLARSQPQTLILPQRRILLESTQKRTIFGWFNRKEKKRFLDPLGEEFLKNKPKPQASQQPVQTQGSLASDNIFEEAQPSTTKPKPADGSPAQQSPTSRSKTVRNIENMVPALDPDPINRRRWERKMAIRDIQHRGRISRKVKIARTEREHLSKSPLFYTSVKKLMLLARQIAGKTVDDAIIQMKYSKKKAAKDVLDHLYLARDEAIVAKGMGLGAAKTYTGDVVKVESDGPQANPNPLLDPKIEATEDKVVALPALSSPTEPKEVIKYMDKKGKRHVVEDSTQMYIDQSWVNRGPHGRSVEYRARGRANMLTHPHTSISFLLKEEKTRIRLAKERDEKQAQKKPWVHHPDRPITKQSQYILW